MDPSSEQLTPPTGGPEQLDLPSVEVGEGAGPTPEKSRPQQAEQAGRAINQAPASAPALSLPPVAVPAPVTTDADDSAAVVGQPAIADDVDVIEKEWVDKAREIVRQTKGDPHAQEQAVEALHRAYLKKRYNRDLKSSTPAEA